MDQTTKQPSVEGFEHVSNIDASQEIDDNMEKHGHSQAAPAPTNVAISASSSYLLKPRFIGCLVGFLLGGMCGMGSYAIIAPFLTYVNNDLGPDPNYFWITICFTVIQAVGLTFVGRISDIFGRRWTFVGGSAISLIGYIVCVTAQSVSALIAGMCLCSAGGTTQTSFYSALGELVPLKHRFLVNGIIYFGGFPISIFGPAITAASILYTPPGWRVMFYVMLASNAVSLLCLYLFYKPPTFREKHERDTLGFFVKNFDYVGSVLFAGGLVIFLIGICWGGSVYPWKSAHVIATIVVGGLTLVAFVVWECTASLTEPLVPMRLFRKTTYTACVLSASLGASQYYALNIIWPIMVTMVFRPADFMTRAWLFTVVGGGFAGGLMISSAFIRWLTHTKIQVLVAMFVGALFYALIATCSPEDEARALVFALLGSISVAWNEAVTFTMSTIEVDDQQDIGVAFGVAGSVRGLVGALASTIFVAIVTNRLTEEVSGRVPVALVTAGLPASSIPDWLVGYSAEQLDSVPGTNATINAIGTDAYKLAAMSAFRTIFFVTLVFSGSGLICNFFVPNVDDKMTNVVVAPLHSVSYEKTASSGEEKSGEETD
ncbi:hypothetical protein AYO20_02643 [Fonsecaea nubica]|uniref:Major facilitator superfamily (MFS) profile domain-containing protein n=1 Tax=Fonsecaea nubica TaxID=856822 RepID=A0A178DAC4_9EURO|nr:hypothetical protein AYO20_02643 [Fonsecaea nubica]OAL38191.1 hypothetical protein AYO20_02643 [Fonsecaea nubica]